jgi:hypothetical protein
VEIILQPAAADRLLERLWGDLFPKFAMVAKRTRLPFQTKEVQYPGTDQTTTAYYMTF